jgi:hypothetical protein
MSGLLRKILFLVWPPYEAHIARKFIDDRTSSNLQERMQSIDTEVRKSLPEGKKQQEEIEVLAKLVFESESGRKEILESKALAFVSAFGVSVSIVAALPVFLSKDWHISPLAAAILTILYVLAIAHLLVAVYYSIEARRVQGLALPNADEFVKAIKEGKQSIADRIVMYVQKAKFNEPILIKKANSLSVTESMFLRGLILVAVASTTSASLLLFSVTPTEVCEIPSTVGLSQAAAENMLIELGLRPILSSQYGSNTTTGVVISQNPSAGSRMQPCSGDVTIVVSLGPVPTPTPTYVPTDTPQPTETSTPVLATPTP